MNTTLAANPGTWLDRLFTFGSVEAARKALADRHPAFQPVRLARVAVVGAAAEGQRFVRTCAERGIRVAAVCDDNPKMVGKEFAGQTVQPTAALERLDRTIPVVVATHRALKPVERVRAMGFGAVLPLGVLQTMAPDVFEPQIFYKGWLEDLVGNRDRYRELHATLADERSRKTLDAILGYRLSGDASVLGPMIEWDLYATTDLFQLGTDEVYVDAGAFDGDTTRLFIERTKGRFEKVYAFEPDPDTFRRLAANFAHEPRVVPINKGVYDRATTLYFDGDGSRHSGIQETGNIKVEVTDIDGVAAGGKVTYIKMNIEAAEPAALEGARRTIQKWKPRLAVSCYHRPGHLWEIPRQVLALRSDYKIYYRQHDGGVIESTMYAL